MNLNDQGLPLPGRELDLEMARILGYEIVDFHGDHKRYPYVYTGGGGCYLVSKHGRIRWTPSTTHAFFQVMEAKRDEWHFVIEMLDDSVVVWLYDAKEPLGTADLAMSEVDTYNKTIVNAVAHAVCSCAWKARQHG